MKDKVQNMEEKENIMEPEEIIEEIDQEEDYTADTLKERKSLLFRMPLVLTAIILYFIISLFDNNVDFNPVHTTLFFTILVVIVVFCIFAYTIDTQTRPEEYRKENVYKRYKKTNDAVDFVSVIPYIMLLLSIVNAFMFSFSPISGTSMEPNFHDDEAVIFSHMTKSFERYDVVILYEESLSEPYLIKRIIGLPGDTVKIENGVVYVNGELLQEDYIDRTQVSTTCVGSQTASCTYVVSEGHYFVLGDNRDGHAVSGQVSGHSIDSRTLGIIDEENIKGKVVFTFKDYNILN